MLSILAISCGASDEVEHGKATKELITLLDNDPALKSMLESSIAKARAINPDRNTNPAQTLEEYYEFITWTETTMPWAMIEKEEYPETPDPGLPDAWWSDTSVSKYTLTKD